MEAPHSVGAAISFFLKSQFFLEKNFKKGTKKTLKKAL